MSVRRGELALGSTTAGAALGNHVRRHAVALGIGAVAACLCLPAFSTSALASGAQLYAFGQNYCGQLGSATNFESLSAANPTPTVVNLPGAVGGVSTLVAGGCYSLVATSSGQLYSFGANAYGQLGREPAEGYGLNEPASPAPGLVTLPGATGLVTQVAAGGSTSLVLTSSGQLYSFGEDGHGALGRVANAPPNATPTLVTLPGATGVVTRIDAGSEDSFAVTSTGQLYAFGNNSWGQLGIATNSGTANANATPTLVTLPGEKGVVTDVSSGERHTLVVTSSGQLYSFGENRYGQLGIATNSGTANANPTPTLVTLPGAVGAVTQVAAGVDHSLVLTSSGQVYAFGDNRLGELGSTTNSGTSTANPTPTLVTLAGAVGVATQIAAGWHDSFVLTSSGQLYGFGDNDWGELGVTTNIETVNPEEFKKGVNANTEGATPNPNPELVPLPGPVGAIDLGPGATHTIVTVEQLPTTTTTTTTTSSTATVTSQTTTTTTSTTSAVKGLLVGNETSTYSVADAVNGGREEGFQFTAKATGKIEELEFRTGSAANTGITGVDLGVFAESSGKPGEVLGQGKVSGQPATSSWIKVTGLSISVTSGTKYWLVVLPLGESTKELHYNEAVRSGGSSMAEDSVGGLTSMTAESAWTGYSQGPAGFQAIGTPKSVSAPTNKSLPTTSPTAEQGQTLTATTGSWENEPTSYTYQWERCNTLGVECVNISTPSSATYVPVEADVGHTIVVKVTASNSAGPASASSLATATVKGASKGLLVGNETSTYSVADAVNGGREEGFQFTAKATGKIEELEFRTASAANTGITGVDLGVFAESSGKPGEVLGQGKVSGQPATSSWIKVTGLSISVTSGTKYWLVVLPLGESTKELHYDEAVKSGGSSMAEDSVGGLTSMTAESSWTGYSQGPAGFQAIGP